MPKTLPRFDSQAVLLRTFGPLIFSRCRRALNDEALAESATQEVFVRIAPRLDVLDPPGAVAVLASACELVCSSPEFRSRSRASLGSAA